MSEVALASWLRQQGHTAQAADGLMRWLGQHPQDDEAWAALASCMIELGEPPKAEVAYRRAIASKPERLDLALPLAHALQAQGKHEVALSVLENASQQAPEDLDLTLAKGMALSTLDRPEEALQVFEQACLSHPDNPLVWSFKSLLSTRLRQYETALSAADQSLALAADHAQGWFARGRVLQKMGRWQEAAQSLEKALQHHPEHVLALNLLASIRVTLAEETGNSAEAVEISQLSAMAQLTLDMQAHLRAGPAVTLNYFRFKHDVEQAQYFLSQGVKTDVVQRLVTLGSNVLAQANPQAPLVLDEATLAALKQFWAQRQTMTLPATTESCLNASVDWAQIERAYLAGKPEIVVIDDFLSPAALAAFQRFNLWTPSWTSEYAENKYLGGFSNKGYLSELHLQLARDLRRAMPGVFQDHRLMELWGFKYDAKLGKGINVHADHAKVNLNFWVTPDEYNLDPNSGGLRLYDVPAPEAWSFDEYNHDAQKIYEFLKANGAKEQVVTYRCNRAVLFNSALFHETDVVNFQDTYVGRRVNMTYLFGAQLGD